MESDFPTVDVRLPLSPDALVSAESMVDVFVERLGIGRDETLAFALRYLVSEGFRSALGAQPLEGRLKVIRLNLRACHDGVWITLTEPGRGMEVNGLYPPYPLDLVGEDIPFANTLHQTLYAQVSSPTRVVFRSGPPGNAQAQTNDDTIRRIDPRGFGILSLCRECETVSTSYDPVEGNSLSAFYPLNLEEHRAIAG